MSYPPPPPPQLSQPAPATVIPPPPHAVARPVPLPPLLPGWTQHVAPGGQLYYFHPATNSSTYVRPSMPIPPPSFSAPPTAGPPPPVAPPKKEKKEKPKTKTDIEGTDWTKVETNKGNVFWTNRITKESVWTIPAEIEEMVKKEKEREKEKEKEIAAGRKREREEALVVEKIDEAEKEAEKADEEVEVKEEVLIVEPKKKRQKQVVMSSIEELEKDEEWQRGVAAQMAAEVERQEEAIIKQQEKSEEGEKAKLGGEVVKEEIVVQKEHPLPQMHQPRMNVSPEEGIALFRTMLSEKDIAPLAPWDMELPKFINDPRYSAIKHLKDRRDLFDEFCKEKIRAQRAAKKAAQEAGGPAIDPLTAYRSLLLAAVTSTRTHFSDFKKAHQKDPRYRNFGKTEGEKEKVFKAWLRDLGEIKRVEQEKKEAAFREMLRADKSIRGGQKWVEVKKRFADDARYTSITSSSLRESLFESYLKSLSSHNPASVAPETAAPVDKAARAAASLREREEQVRIEKERSARNAMAARGALGREEDEREYRSLLIDVVRAHDARWDSALPTIERDPRSIACQLSLRDRRQLFDQHLTTLYSKRLSALESLFDSHSPDLTTPFTSVLPSVVDSPVAERLVGHNLDKLESLYEAWSKKRLENAKKEFEALLKENAVLEHWGRLQKKDKEEKGKEVLDEDEEGGDDAIDLVDMAKQIDVKAIHAVLKHDKRYLIFDYDPESRNQWIVDYLNQLEAPKETVHQR